jgi:transposase-like protein
MSTGGDQAQYATGEMQEIWRQVGEGSLPDCPRCHVAMHRRTIGGGSFGLGYARQRSWFLCPRCHRSAIFDTVRGTRN